MKFLQVLERDEETGCRLLAGVSCNGGGHVGIGGPHLNTVYLHFTPIGCRSTKSSCFNGKV